MQQHIRRWLFNTAARRQHRLFLILLVLVTCAILYRNAKSGGGGGGSIQSIQVKIDTTLTDQPVASLNSDLVDPEDSLRTDKFKQEFDSIIDKYCDSRDNKLSLSCIKRIDEFDKSIEAKRSSRVRPRFDKCSDCIYKRVGPKNYEKVYFYHHTFWQISDDSNAFNKRALRLQLMSFLVTQNLCCTRLIVWKLSSFGAKLEKDLRREFKYYLDSKSLVIKLFDFEELCSFRDTKSDFYSAFADHPVCKSKPNLEGNHLVSLSDFIRFFVLDLYGGIYTDGDVIYLKDTRILWNRNIIYKWSYTAYYNTAVLGFNKYEVPNTVNMLNSFVRSTSSLNDLISAFHPFALAARLPQLESTNVYDLKLVKMYHSSVFDPAWLCNDGVIHRPTPLTPCGFRDFNNNLDVERDAFRPDQFFPGAFTYHLHLKDCQTLIKNNSYFQYFEDYFKTVLILAK